MFFVNWLTFSSPSVYCPNIIKPDYGTLVAEYRSWGHNEYYGLEKDQLSAHRCTYEELGITESGEYLVDP